MAPSSDEYHQYINVLKQNSTYQKLLGLSDKSVLRLHSKGRYWQRIINIGNYEEISTDSKNRL